MWFEVVYDCQGEKEDHNLHLPQPWRRKTCPEKTGGVAAVLLLMHSVWR